MISFVAFFSSKTVKCISNLYVLLELTFPQPPQSTFFSSEYDLDITVESFIFLALLYETIGEDKKTFPTSSSLYRNGSKYLISFTSFLSISYVVLLVRLVLLVPLVV